MEKIGSKAKPAQLKNTRNGFIVALTTISMDMVSHEPKPCLAHCLPADGLITWILAPYA